MKKQNIFYRKTALITGASSGIGKAISVTLAQYGCNLVICSRNRKTLQMIKKQLENQYLISVSIIVTDLSLPDSAQKLYQEIVDSGMAIDILINNAGLGINTRDEFRNPEKVRSMLDVMVVQPALLSHFFGKDMLKSGTGYILNVSSIVAHFPLASTLCYAPAKTFLSAFTRYLRYTWKQNGINITTLEPGGTRTPYFRHNQIPISDIHLKSLYSPEKTAEKAISVLAKNRKRVIPGLVSKASYLAGRLIPSQWLYAFQKSKRKDDPVFSMKHLYPDNRKNALITGASSGIGKDIAEELAKKGYDLILVSRREVILNQLKKEWEKTYSIRVTVFAMDLSEYNAAFELYRLCRINNLKISVLINNAGFGLKTEEEILYPQKFEQMLRLMVVNFTIQSHLFARDMASIGGGYIMNVSSVTAYFPVGMMKSYGAMKAYDLAYSRSLHYELKSHNISVTCLMPGSVATEFMDNCGLNIPPAFRWVSKLFFCSSKRVARHGIRRMFGKKLLAIPGILTKLFLILKMIIPERWMYHLFILIEKLRIKLSKQNSKEREQSECE